MKKILSIWTRPLTDEELKHFRKSELGKKTLSLGFLSVMGPADCTQLRTLNVKRYVDRVDLGGGQYFYDEIAQTPATGGKKVPVTWAEVDLSFYYLLSAANNICIPVFTDEKYLSNIGPIYFESIHTEAFINGFSYADRALGSWSKRRPFFQSLFGANYPDPNGDTSKNIKEKLKQIFAKSINK